MSTMVGRRRGSHPGRLIGGGGGACHVRTGWGVNPGGSGTLIWSKSCWVIGHITPMNNTSNITAVAAMIGA
jgi:hypothetical protein